MAHRSSPRRFRPTGVGSYTATSSHPFNERFFEELDARLAREAVAPAIAPPSVLLGDVDPLGAVARAARFTPAKA